MSIMILKFPNSQVLTPFTPNKLYRHQSSYWWTKPLLLPWKLLRNLTKMVAKVRKLRFSKALVRIKSSNPKEKALDAAVSQPDQTVDPLASKTKAQDIRTFSLFLFVCFCCCCCCCFFFFCCRGMYDTLFMINESIFLLFPISSSYTLCDSLLQHMMLIGCHFNLSRINYHILLM